MTQDAVTDTRPPSSRATNPSDGAGERDLDRMRLGGPACREPGSPGPAEDQRPRLRADEGEPPLALDGAVPDLEPELTLERLCERRRIADEPDLGEAEQLGRREGAGCARLADPAMRDQLDDAAGRVVEVDRLRVPVREVEHGLAGLRVGQELDPVTGPGERRLEAVARDEEREVVERQARRRSELEHGLPDLDRQPAIVAAGQWQPERASVERGEGGQKARRGLETDVSELERHRADSITRRSPDDRLKPVAG